VADSFKDFVAKWSQPTLWITMITSVIYFIIWLVQLNVATVDGAAERATMLQEIIEMRRENYNQAITQAKMLSVLEQLVRTQNQLETRMTRNEGWITDNSNHRHK